MQIDKRGKKVKKYLFILLAAAVFSSCSTTQAEKPLVSQEDNRGSIHAKNSYFIIDDQAVFDKLDTAEYKMLINLEDFNPEILWSLMKEAAEENNITVTEAEEPMKKGYRKVQYLDSKYGMLKNFGYILRYRHPYKKFVSYESAENEMDSKYDITLKFRDSDVDKSLSAPMSVGSAFDSIKTDAEMEADISPYGIKFSKSIKVKPKTKEYGLFDDRFESNLKSYATLYPELLDLQLPPETEINPVGGLTVLEEKIEPAVLTLDCGAEMEVAFSTFYIKGKTLVSEVSYDFDIDYKVKDSAGNKVKKRLTLEEFKQAENFYKSLLIKYDEKLNFGWSKTNFVFDSLPTLE